MGKYGNDLLQNLAVYAESLTGFGAKGLTPEKFIAAAAELLSDKTPFRIDEKDKKALLSLLQMSFDYTDDLADFVQRLRQICAKNHSGNGSPDVMENYLKEAGILFQSRAVSVSSVIINIIKYPGKNIKAFLRFDAEQEENNQNTESDEFDDFDDELFDFDELDDFDDFDDDFDSVSYVRDSVKTLTDETKELKNALLQNIIGQDYAVNSFVAGYFRSEMLSITDNDRTRPKAIFLFAGPPGVGKTFLAESAAKCLGLPYKRFDMSEYSDKEAPMTFIGSDKVYKNSKEGAVTSFVSRNPKCVLLFDEVEKAHINIIHLFLQMLDAGRLKDTYTEQEVSFTDAIMIFTTNAGRKLYEDTDQTDFSGLSRKVILKAIQKDVKPETNAPMFPSAICSRFNTGNVVMFNHMTAGSLYEIIRRELLRHAESLKKSAGIEIKIDEMVYTALLFSEGGIADARSIRSKAERFFDEQLYEYFRMGKPEMASYLTDLTISVELPENDPSLRSLFENPEPPKIFVFSDGDNAGDFSRTVKNAGVCILSDLEKARQELENGFDMAVIDIYCGVRKYSDEMNMEDVDSDARDIFWYIKENYPELPIYLLQKEDMPVNPESLSSYKALGVRDVLTVGSFDDNILPAQIAKAAELIHRQKSMDTLAQSNKLVSFETAQTYDLVENNGVIKLFDFEMSVAVDAEDSRNILSGVSRPDLRFDQVIGAGDAKKELGYFAEYMKNPKKFIGTGVSAPKGILLYGPPGTGKTMLAKAMAGECDVTYIAAEGNQFISKYSGGGPEKVHELFRIARKYAPSILFIDEIDAIARERTGGGSSEDTLTTFLTEMDGFRTNPRKPVFVLAATNFDPEPGSAKSLDAALMRRFDRRIYIGLPTRDDRIRYLNMMLAQKPALRLSKEKIESIAVRSTGMSLAQLQSVTELSLRTALRDGKPFVSDEIFDEAFEVFNSGEEKHWDESTLQRVARHEAGHALINWLNGETPSYLTIVARGDHGGYMMHDDLAQKHLSTRQELRDRIRCSLGGRAAEIVYYGAEDGISTGASGDLLNATSIAKRMICSYGMNEEFGLAVISSAEAAGELSIELRNAVNKILSAEMTKAVRLISDNRKAIDALVERLITDNYLTGPEINEILSSNHEQ